MIKVFRFSLALVCILFFFSPVFAQGKKNIMRSWIKREAFDLAKNEPVDDTLYTRYSFSKNALYISFYPGWNDYRQDWSLSGDRLTIGYDTYIIESLTDSTLTISLQGFRRIVFDEESYLNRKEKPVVVGQLGGEPVYEATRYITPRYENEDFQKTIKQNLVGYNIKRAITFNASSIVKKDGTVDSVHVINGITYGFDEEVCKQLRQTSKKWKAAVYNGQPVQARMVYTIKYLDSIVR